MALNLSTLTSPATSGDVLAEALTTADFLEPVPVLRNLARGSNKGGDAEQSVALNQPKALPLDANGKGYLYLSGVTGNYASVPNAANLNGITDFVMEAKDVYLSDWTTGNAAFFSKYISGNSAFIFRQQLTNISIYALYGGVAENSTFAHGLTGAATASIRITRLGTSLTAELDTGSGYVAIGSTRTVPAAALDTTTNPLEIGSSFAGAGDRLLGKMSRARMWDNATMAGDPVLDVDFTSTNVRHGATKFACATGQVVTINQDSSSSNDVATIIKKPVLRFDGVNDGLRGLFGQTITDGYMFAAFSVLGNGGESFGRLFTLNSTGASDDAAESYILAYKYLNTINGFSGATGSNTTSHAGLYSPENGDILNEHKFTASSQLGEVNGADVKTNTANLSSVSIEEFNICFDQDQNKSVSVDLEYLALFPATITDAQADSVRNYINNRNNVFDLKDGFGYYFYDAQKAPVGNITDLNTWNGRIVGSDNGDTDKLATQATANDQPVGDGYVVTFADNSDFLTIPSTTQAGWQICGTSKGTFAYKVNNYAVTELNLLGNLGSTSFRQAGDLYGVILLPESATGKDIEEARKLLIDRGAADGTTASNYFAAWYNRDDIVNFGNVDFTSATNMQSAFQLSNSLSSFNVSELPSAWNLVNTWKECTSLTSFSTKIPSATNCGDAWAYCFSLSDFRTTDIKNCSAFGSAWRNCSSLTSFPQDAKLGTEASNVNFSNAWKASGLTSFPALDLSNGNNFLDTWRECSSLQSFAADAKLGTDSSNVIVGSAWQQSGLTSFSTPLPTASNVAYAWFRCYDLVSFSSELPVATSTFRAWEDCTSLADFSADVFANWNPSSITSGIFNNAWDGCTSLTAQSVENILVPIDSSGKHATSTGASGGTALADAGIDIDYDGSGLTAATTAAITSLKSKGWSIFINSVEQ